MMAGLGFWGLTALVYVGLVAIISLVAVVYGDADRRGDAREVLRLLLKRDEHRR